MGSAVQLTLDLDWGLPAPVAAPPRAAVAAPVGTDGLPLNRHMRALVADVRARVPALGHLDPERILFTISHAKARSQVGTYAFIVPLRFEGGSASTVWRKRHYRMPEVEYEGVRVLYVIYLLCPRFFDLPVAKKLHTVFHELLHISESFNGDLRRLPGRAWAHGPSRGAYDSQVGELVETYLASWGSKWPEPAEFLRRTMGEVARECGGVRYPRIRRPRPYPG